MSIKPLWLLNMCCLAASLTCACAGEEAPPYGSGGTSGTSGAGPTSSSAGGIGGTNAAGSTEGATTAGPTTSTTTSGSGAGGEITTGGETTSGGETTAGGAGGESSSGTGGSDAASGGSNTSMSAGGGDVGGTEGDGGTAGTGGATHSTDRDEFFGDSRCTDEFELCEDFEAESLDTDIWSVRGPAPTIDDARAARGSRSAHFHTVDNGLSYIEQTLTFPAAGNRYFARLFVYFDSMPSAPEWAHWSIAGALGSGTEAEIRVGGQYDNVINRFGVGSDHGPTGDWTNLDDDPAGSPREVPVGEWICIEWLHDGGANETRFYWDGVEHPSLFTAADVHGGDQNESYLLPQFESVWVGWWLYQADTVPGEFDVWIDEVVFDDERIGCDR